MYLGDNNNMIMMAIAKVKSSDESEYRVYIENCHGSDEANFMLFVSGMSNALDEPEVTMSILHSWFQMDLAWTSGPC